MQFTVLLVVLLFALIFQSPYKQIGIDEQGAFVEGKGQLQRVAFIRANGVYLVARVTSFINAPKKWYPNYVVIFRDSVSKDNYAILRSFAAQQILLNPNKDQKG
ncbi:hypothetical protein OFY17_13720 [Marinomonas sp. C2222]|uniref:Uncharacterized protein n=1 Tax=Marinomonas sargassi TaxID=2984494 RepID=A0ABT2YVV9_9GAMM|nr:hypothetical protein [Marinomonas sargassi]MCV2403925.1 hypothetical protein [Marinomonas sargassi]